MASDTEMADDTVPTRLYSKPRFGNLWRGPSRPMAGGIRTTNHASHSASPPQSAASTSRRSSLANLVHGLDVADSHEQQEVAEQLAGGDEAAEEDEDEGEEEGEEEDEEEEDTDDEEEEDDDESDTDTEEDHAQGRSTESKPTSRADATPTKASLVTEDAMEGIESNGITVHDPDSEATGVVVTVTNEVATPPPTTASTVPPPSAASTLTEPPTSRAAEPTAEAPATQEPAAKPKSKAVKRKHRSPSRSPPPAVPPPPVRTIRLDITLGGPTNYEVDISRKAKDTGQRDPTPPPIALMKAPPESEDEEKPADDGAEGGKKKKRKKKSAAQEYYDTSDPFIDDSELAVDQRTYFAQTKQQGFYVSSGEVALLKDKSPKKPPRSKKAPAASASGVGAGDGTRDSPIALVDEEGSSASTVHGAISKGIKGVGLVSSSGVIGGGGKSDTKEKGNKVEQEDEGDETAGQKRKRWTTVVEGGKRRKIVNINSFHPDLKAGVESVKELIAKENWEQKGKFPPSLKPPLAQLALLAIKLDEYDDHFFNLMPTLFPYNKFTMTKLIKRMVYADHVGLLQERQEQLLKQLEELATSGFAQAEQEWEKNVAAWHTRQEKLRAEAANNPSISTAGAGVGENGSAGGSGAPTRHPTEEKDAVEVGGDGAGQDAKSTATAAGHGTHPPGKKYRLTEQMKGIIWDLVLLSNEACRLENEKNTYEGSVIQVSEQGLRKVLYQKIVAAFPEGWMSSGQISRDVSAIKKRLEREAEQDG
ncbi:hypothetical protein H1R20_g13982, partial [Candolleomyces eurysporus]